MRSCDGTTHGRSAGFPMLALAAIGRAGCGRFDGRPEVTSKQPSGTVQVRQIGIGEVDAAIQVNASDFSTLSGIIGGLGGIYGEFPGAPVVSVFGPNGSQTGFQSGHALFELTEKTAAVA